VTSLSDYSSSIACTRNGNPGPSGNGRSLNVTLAASDVLVCTITNRRSQVDLLIEASSRTSCERLAA
jgi:hypothetical protein